MTTQTIERSITAFLDGEDSIEIDNIIHSTEGAAKFGFQGALVGGVTVYSWAVPALIEALGEEWLDSGWIDFRLRRPVYPGDEITTRVTPTESGVDFSMAKADGEVCIAGTAGLGQADFYSAHRRRPEPSGRASGRSADPADPLRTCPSARTCLRWPCPCRPRTPPTTSTSSPAIRIRAGAATTPASTPAGSPDAAYA